MLFLGYKCYVFDCDGVVLNSNRVKTEAFYNATLPYGHEAAQAMVDFHVENGGVSRYKKFAYFLENIAPNLGGGARSPGLEQMLESYANNVRSGLLSCDLAPGISEFRQRTADARWLIVSGGDQAELCDVFAKRGIAAWFDGGIFGSPDTKDHILDREIRDNNITGPALFLGDSKYDYRAANAAGLDFVFVSGWSEVSDWKSWAAKNGLKTVESIKALLQ